MRYNNTFYRTSCDPFSANQRFQIICKTDKKIYIDYILAQIPVFNNLYVFDCFSFSHDNSNILNDKIDKVLNNLHVFL